MADQSTRADKREGREEASTTSTIQHQRTMEDAERAREPIYTGMVPGEDGKPQERTLRRLSTGGFVDDQSGQPVKNVTGVHKVGSKAEADAEGIAKPTGPEDLHGEEYLKALPAARSALIKGYAEGRVAFPSGFSQRSLANRQVLADIAQYDPSFDATNYQARAKTRADFTSGKSAQNVTAIDTTIGHFGSLLKAGDELDNFRESVLPGITTLNQVKNWYNSSRGDPRIVKFEEAKDAVTRELTRVFRGTAGNVADIKAWEQAVSNSMTPEQLHGAVEQGVELLASRINAVGEQYRRGMGTTADVTELLTPAAKKTLGQLPGGETILGDLSTTVGGTRGTDTGGRGQSATPRTSGESAPARQGAAGAPAAGGLPADLPPPTGVAEGTKATDDQTGKVIAILRGGKWVPP
jgi:hypothetical protein